MSRDPVQVGYSSGSGPGSYARGLFVALQILTGLLNLFYALVWQIRLPSESYTQGHAPFWRRGYFFHHLPLFLALVAGVVAFATLVRIRPARPWMVVISALNVVLSSLLMLVRPD